MPRRKLSREAAQAELRRRLGEVPQLTAEMLAGKHAEQVAYIRSALALRFVLCVCSRRAGKTWANCIILLLTALATPGVTCIYVGITEKQVRKTAWVKIWKPLLKKLGVEHTSTEDMSTTLGNGSVIHFGSLVNENHANTWLGDSLAGGCAILDEVQDASSDLLVAAERVIGPALTDCTEEHPEPGRLIWSGTFPETPAGRVWEMYEEAGRPDSVTKLHGWNRFSNPYLINQRKHLDEDLARLHVTEAEPFIQREYFGNPIYDKNATAYGFDPVANTYDPIAPSWLAALKLYPFTIAASVPPPGCDTFVVGLDPAGRVDRYAIEVWAFGKASDRLYQVFEAITDKPPPADLQQSHANAVLGYINKLYPNVIGWVRDHGSAAINDDTLLREHGIANIDCAIKTGLKDRVDRMRDLLWQRRAFVMKGSKLAEDFTKARWSMEARAKGKWEWHSSHHPDAADAAIYPLQRWVSFYKAPPQKLTQEQVIEQLVAATWKPQISYGYSDPMAVGQPASTYRDAAYGGPTE
jgi:hypothetical protein